MCSKPKSLETLGWTWQIAELSKFYDDFGSRTVFHPLASSSRMTGFARWFAQGAALALCVCAVLFASGFVVFVSMIERIESPPAGRADGIVVLTGGSQRIGDAIDLLAAGYGRRLLISGVNEKTSRDEIARLNPNQRHLIECCVDLDYRARNTIGNAIETRRWMQRNHFGSITVVTSNYHMPRTLVEIEHALKASGSVLPHAVVTDGFDVTHWWSDAGTARLLLAEYVKCLAAWIRIRFEGDPEHSRLAALT